MSGPVALCGFRPRSNLWTPWLSILMSFIGGCGESPLSGTHESSSRVYADWNWLFSSSALVSASLRRSPFTSFNGATPVVSCFWLFRYVQSLFGLLVISPLMTSSIYVSCAFLTSCCVNFCRCLYLLQSFDFFDVFAFLCALLFLLASLLMFLYLSFDGFVSHRC